LALAKLNKLEGKWEHFLNQDCHTGVKRGIELEIPSASAGSKIKKKSVPI
jgi:hypothetical protein